MEYDIVIIGAGPVGLSFALSLKNSQFKIILIEKSPQTSIQNPQPDGREIALTHLSKNILKDLGCWQYLVDHGMSFIKKAQVINGDSDYAIDFASKNSSDLGYLISNHKIRTQLFNKVAQLKNVEILTATGVTNIATNNVKASVNLDNGEILTPKLIVAADSRFSNSRSQMGIGTRRNDFARTAIVCHLSHELPHDSTAFECFHYGGTLAILPMLANKSSAVITVPNSQLDAIMNSSPAEFATDITARLKYKLGAMLLVGDRHSYPLTAVHAKQFVKPRFALLGDAAVGMHPVTAHGFNLGLQGAVNLAKIINNSPDCGSLELLSKYQTQHMRITKPMYLGTNGIVDFFTNETKAVKLLRKIAMRTVNNFTPLKKIIVHKLTDTNQLAKSGKFTKLPSLPKIFKPSFLRKF